MDSLTYAIEGGGVSVSVTITEVDGALRFDLAVDASTGTIGDLNAIYLDIADETLLDGLTVSGSDVTGSEFDADSVRRLDNFTNINGEVLNELGAFDLGVQFGTQGISRDDIQTTSFLLESADRPLTLEDFALQDSALRLTSVGEIGGSRDGSLKLGGEVGPVPEEPEDTGGEGGAGDGGDGDGGWDGGEGGSGPSGGPGGGDLEGPSDADEEDTLEPGGPLSGYDVGLMSGYGGMDVYEEAAVYAPEPYYDATPTDTGDGIF